MSGQRIKQHQYPVLTSHLTATEAKGMLNHYVLIDVVQHTVLFGCQGSQEGRHLTA